MRIQLLIRVRAQRTDGYKYEKVIDSHTKASAGLPPRRLRTGGKRRA